MAKARVDVTCRECGKVFEKEAIKRNRREANDWEEWAAKQEWLCPDCYAKAQKEAREEEIAERRAKTEDTNSTMTLPELEGTEKQVAWANDIRAGAIEELKKTIKPEYNRAIEDALAGKTSAKWWIENRGAGLALVLLEEVHIAVLKYATAEQRSAVRTGFAGRSDDFAKRMIAELDRLDNPEAVEEEKPVEPAEETKAEEKKPEPQKTLWRKVAFNEQNIVTTTECGLLIAMPHSSEYDGYKFWTSKKLVREGRHGCEYLLSVNDGMTFSIKKTGKGRYNKFETIDEQTITAEELADAFGGYVDEAPNTYHEEVDEYREVVINHIPAKLEPVENPEVDADLLR